MTADLNHRWRERLPPFDGATLSSPGGRWLALPRLREVLAAIIPELQQDTSGQSLFVADDWYEHDGFVTEPREISWDAAAAWVATDESLCAARHQDTYVRKALFPDGAGFYLRFYIPDQTETTDFGSGWWGTFEVTGTPELVQRIAAVITEGQGVEMVVEAAGPYFDACYGG